LRKAQTPKLKPQSGFSPRKGLNGNPFFAEGKKRLE
jgi:hypothetical protein